MLQKLRCDLDQRGAHSTASPGHHNQAHPSIPGLQHSWARKPKPRECTLSRLTSQTKTCLQHRLGLGLGGEWRPLIFRLHEPPLLQVLKYPKIPILSLQIYYPGTGT